MRKRLLNILLVFMMVVGLMPGMSLTAYAAPTETLLTTITPTGKTTYSETTSGVVTVSHNNDSYNGNGGWQWYSTQGTLTISGCEGYTITKVIFRQKPNRNFTDSSEPFELHFNKMDETNHYASQENYQINGVTSIEVYGYATPTATHSVTITPGNNMTKTTDSGAASQAGLSGAMTDVVYTANDGYYFPTDYSVAAVNGISVTRDSYTQITVSGTPTADATITLTAPTAKTTPAAPTTAAAVDCTTTDNNDGKLTGVTTAMEYMKSDAADWTAGTGSDITGLVPGTYYVRLKATDTTNASGNQELTVKGFISYTVTFKVANGKWNEGEGDAATADKTVTLTGHDGDTLKLTADQIPAAGSKPNDTYKAGSWDTTPSAEIAITGATTYTYTYSQKNSISQTVTFKVANGKWDDGTTANKTVTLTGYEGDTLKLTADQIPAVGTKPNDTYKAGNWDVTPSTDTEITGATSYTYTYAQKDSISQTVTFKVANGKWDDGTTADKTVTLTGYEGDTLKLAASQIPTVGTKPNDTYKAGSWDVTPSTDTAITVATTYTYTYVAKEAAVVTKAPEGKTLTYNGQEQALVTAGEATGGEMQYALGTATEATQPYTTSIPTKTNAGTYYVFYHVKGDENHNDTEAACVTVTISPVNKDALNNKISEAETYYNSIKENNDYSSIADTLKAAIDTAKAVATNDNQTVTQVSDAATTLSDALNKAIADVKELDDTAAANAVIDKINALPTKEDITATDAIETAIDNARSAYDDLTEDQKAKVTNLTKLQDVEDAIYDLIVYSAIEGSGSSWTKGNTTGSVFKFKRNINDTKTIGKFDSVLVDGNEVAKSNYTAVKGSVIITLSPSYLETLSVGEHTLTAVFNDYKTSTVSFKVVARPTPVTPDYVVPKTGITSNDQLFTFLLPTGLVGLLGACLFLDDKKKYKK